MADLSTTYMGIALQNPVVVASCGLVKNLDGVRRAADAGAGAVVLKSLFEEQLAADSAELHQALAGADHPEALGYVQAELGMRYGAGDYIRLIREAKKAVPIPVIASINCISPRWWIQYAAQIADAGPDALELNISRMPVDPDCPGSEIERTYVSIVEDIRRAVKIPLAVKIGPYFSSLASVAKQLAARGASALVLFNRFYQPDIDTDGFHMAAAKPFSSPEDVHLSLRWIALLSRQIPCDFAASTGVHDAQGVVKQLLAGAKVVQACSTFYLHGFERVGQMLEGLKAWMDAKGFSCLEEVRACMAQELAETPEIRERLQYIRVFGKLE